MLSAVEIRMSRNEEVSQATKGDDSLAVVTSTNLPGGVAAAGLRDRAILGLANPTAQQYSRHAQGPNRNRMRFLILT
jgi:hypothetical protein